MTTAPISLRPAQPTTAEGLRFARYLDDAADGIFRFMLGKNSEQVVAKAYRTPGHDLSFEHVTFAQNGGTIVGTTSAYSSKQHEQSSESPLIRAAGWRTVRMAAVSTAAASLFRFIDTVADGDFYLQAIAVDPDRRGLGIGSKLFGHVEDEARRVGCGRLTLVVAVENEGARRLYERMGMTIEATSPKSALLPDGQVHRMAKAL
ncbi:MAG: GNAT family N-acetyltransferase [Acidimicrobiia bacterium]